MFNPAFPSDAALSLSAPESRAETSLARSKTWAAYALLGYAAAKIVSEPADPDNPAESEVDDTGHATGAVPAHAPSDPDEPPKKKVRRKKDESGFDHSDPGPILAALKEHAKAAVKAGGIERPFAVPPRVLAEYCLDVLREDLLK